MTDLRPRHDLSLVLRVADLLEGARLRVWLCGGWAEELRGLRAPRQHSKVVLLYPGRDLDRVDRFLESAVAVDEVVEWRRLHERGFLIEGVLVELVLVQRDARGWFTELPAGRHRWPPDVFSTAGRVPVASEAALAGYRVVRAAQLATRAA